MAIRQSPPGEGRGKGRLHFTYVPTSAKTPWHAYVAGPCMWFDCHEKGKTKPCLDVVTEGALTCPRCVEISPPVPTGYLPLYRAADGKPVMVIVHEYTREIVDALPFHARVLVKREHGVGEGVAVTRTLDQQPKFITTLAEKSRPAQPLHSLLRIWGYPELIEWHNETTGDNVPVCITHPIRKVRTPIVPPAAPSAPVDTSTMSQTSMEAIEIIRQRNEAFVAQTRNGKKPD